MPHFVIVLIPYINLLNLPWIIKCLFLRNMEPLKVISNIISHKGLSLLCIFIFLYLMGINTLLREVKICFCLPSEKESSLKGKNLLPLGANSFLLQLTTFQKGPCAQESKQEVIEVVCLVKNFWKIYQAYLVP